MVAAAGAAGAPGSFGGLRFASAFNSPVEGSRCQKIPESSTRGFGNFCLGASWGGACLCNEAKVSTTTSKLVTRTQQSLLNLRGLASHRQRVTSFRRAHPRFGDGNAERAQRTVRFLCGSLSLRPK